MSLVRNENSLTAIPLEILNLIQENLNLYVLITLATTSKELFQLCTSNNVLGPRFKKDFPEKTEPEQDYYQAYIRVVEYEELDRFSRNINNMMFDCKRNNQDAIKAFVKQEGAEQALATISGKMGFPGTYWLRKRGSQAFCDEIWKYFEEEHKIRLNYWNVSSEDVKKQAVRLKFAIQLNQPIEVISKFAVKYDIHAFDPTQLEDRKSFIDAITHNHLDMIRVFLACQFDSYRDIDEQFDINNPSAVASVSDRDSGSDSDSDVSRSGHGSDSGSDSDSDDAKPYHTEIDETSFKSQMKYPLLAGIYANQLEAVQLMLQHHLDINHEFGPNKNSALHYAAHWSKKEIAKVLLAVGANLSATNKGKKTPVYVAAAAGRFSIVRLFFETNAELVLEQCKNSDSAKSPLYAALFYGHDDIAAYLIDKHAPINEIIANNRDLLMHCIQNNYVECVAILLKHGAKPVSNTKEAKRKPVLYLAAELGHAAIFTLLVSYGERIAESDYKGMSCLHIARENRHLGMIEEMVARYHVDVNEKHKDLTCLHYLLKDENEDSYSKTPKANPEDIVMVLLKAHADPWPLLPIEDNDGGGAIHLACKKGYLQCVTKMLDDHPALIHQKNVYGETPIFYAIAKGGRDIVVELLKRGARLDVISKHPDRLGFTPLHLAAKYNLYFIIDLLTAADVNPEIEADKKKPLALTTMLGAQIKLASHAWHYQESHGLSKHSIFAEAKPVTQTESTFNLKK